MFLYQIRGDRKYMIDEIKKDNTNDLIENKDDDQKKNELPCKRIAYVVPIDNSHFDLVASLITPLYEEEPFNFLFIGPTGFYTRQIADRVAQSIEKTFNRNAFLVINQYITELLLINNYDAEILDRGFYTIYIAKIIDELFDELNNYQEHSSVKLITEEQNSYKSKLSLLRTLSKSNTVVQYIVEIFEKIWELELFGESNNVLQYQELYELSQSLMKDESIFAQVIREIVLKMKEVAQKLQSKNVYDSISVYNWYINNAKFVEKDRKYLVLSGFFDLPPLLRKSIGELLKKSENTIFFVWQKVEDKGFNQLDDIYEFLEENNFIFDYSLCKEKITSTKKILSQKKITQVNVENVYFQYQYLIKRVKSLLLEGVKPEEIGIIVPTHQHAMYIMEEFEEGGIPYRYSGKISLTESQIAKILLQPIITIQNYYRVEDLLTLIESPLIPERELTMDEIEQLFKEYNFFSVNLDPSEMKDKKKRYEAYFENLDKDIQLLKEQLNLDKLNTENENDENDDESDMFLSRLERLRKLENFRIIMESVFKLLDNIQENKRNDVNFFDWYKNFIKDSFEKFSFLSKGSSYSSYFSRSILRSIGKELNAFSKFVDTLNKLEIYVKKLKESSIVRELKSWDKIFKFFLVLLNAEGYRETFKSANVVDIIDISTARFLDKKYKLFVEFTDDHYPSINKINPLLYRTTNNRTKIYDYLEEIERRSLILSLIFSEQTELIFPRSTNIGEELVPSKYLYEFSRSYEFAEFSDEDIFKEIDYRIYELRKNAIFTKDTKKMKSEDFVVGPVEIYEFSHSKLSAYQSCPLYFYFLNVANVTRPQKFSERIALSNGIITHRVLKKFFEKQPIQILHNDDLKRKIEDWIREEYKSVFPEGIWKYSIPQEMKVNEISQELFPFLSDFLSSGRIINLNAKSFSASTQRKTKSDKLISSSTLALEKEFKIPFGSYSLLARVDRIDKTEVWHDQACITDVPTYAIIDYKFSSSSVGNSQIEQLFLYDFIISRSSESVIPNGNKTNVYLIFLSTKRLKEDNSYKYTYIKSERIEGENFGKSKVRYLLPIKAINSSNEKKDNNKDNMYVYDKDFEDWLVKLIERITKTGDFTPVFIDPNPKSFAAILQKSLPENLQLDIAKGSFETKKCRSKINNASCPYEQLCSIFEIYGVKLIES